MKTCTTTKPSKRTTCYNTIVASKTKLYIYKQTCTHNTLFQSITITHSCNQNTFDVYILFLYMYLMKHISRRVTNTRRPLLSGEHLGDFPSNRAQIFHVSFGTDCSTLTPLSAHPAHKHCQTTVLYNNGMTIG